MGHESADAVCDCSSPEWDEKSEPLAEASRQLNGSENRDAGQPCTALLRQPNRFRTTAGLASRELAGLSKPRGRRRIKRIASPFPSLARHRFGVRLLRESSSRFAAGPHDSLFHRKHPRRMVTTVGGEIPAVGRPSQVNDITCVSGERRALCPSQRPRLSPSCHCLRWRDTCCWATISRHGHRLCDR